MQRQAQLASQPEPVQAPESPLQPVQRQLDEQSLEPPRQEAVAPPRVVETPAQVQARQVQELNATQPKLTPEQVADINAQKALNDAPTEAMMQEARKYKSADEFVSKNRLAAEARITELQKQIDDGERSVDSLMRKTRKAPNAEEAIKFESQAQVIRKQLRPLKEEQFGLKDALDSRYGEDSIYIQTPAEREAFLKSTGHFKARELKTAVKKYTDLYNQAHTEAKAPAPQTPKPEAPQATVAAFNSF